MSSFRSYPWIGWRWLFPITVLIFLVSTKSEFCRDVNESNAKDSGKGRSLFIATCDTRSGYKEFQALKVWNITGMGLRAHGIKIFNVCKGKNWGAHGFLTKPLLYSNFIADILKSNSNPDKVHVLLMDSDTFWSVNNPDLIWKKFDCVRGEKEIVVSTEMSCWIGRYCTKEDIDRFYGSVRDAPSFSPFLNSGLIMGSAVHVKSMLDFVIAHNQSYFIAYKKLKFDDQYAVADYAINRFPARVRLDLHQQLFASLSILAPADPPDTGWPFACRSGDIDPSCVIWSDLLNKLGHFSLNQSDCTLHRKLWTGMPLEVELNTLSENPIAWHGNGVGKNLYKRYAHLSYVCNLKKLNFTDETYLNYVENY